MKHTEEDLFFGIDHTIGNKKYKVHKIYTTVESKSTNQSGNSNDYTYRSDLTDGDLIFNDSCLTSPNISVGDKVVIYLVSNGNNCRVTRVENLTKNETYKYKKILDQATNGRTGFALNLVPISNTGSAVFLYVVGLLGCIGMALKTGGIGLFAGAAFFAFLIGKSFYDPIKMVRKCNEIDHSINKFIDVAPSDLETQ